MPCNLWANLFVEPVLTLVADLDDDGTLDGVPFFGEGHISCDALEILDLGHGVADPYPVFLDLSRQSATGFNGPLNDMERIPRQSRHVIGHVPVFGLSLIHI